MPKTPRPLAPVAVPITAFAGGPGIHACSGAALDHCDDLVGGRTAEAYRSLSRSGRLSSTAGRIGDWEWRHGNYIDAIGCGVRSVRQHEIGNTSATQGVGFVCLEGVGHADHQHARLLGLSLHLSPQPTLFLLREQVVRQSGGGRAA